MSLRAEMSLTHHLLFGNLTNDLPDKLCQFYQVDIQPHRMGILGETHPFTGPMNEIEWHSTLSGRCLFVVYFLDSLMDISRIREGLMAAQLTQI